MRMQFMSAPEIKLYHSDVYVPDWMWKPAMQLIKTIDVTSPYAIGRHVQKALNGEDVRWSHDLHFVPFVRAFNKIKNGDDSEIFEIETTEGVVTKVVARTSYDEDSDISIVVRNGKICSAWRNSSDDTHGTLDTSKYEQDPDEYFSEEDFADDLEFEEE